MAGDARAGGARGAVAGAVLLAGLGGLIAWTLGSRAPASPGAASLASPPALLAVFDSVWLLALAGPFRVAGADRLGWIAIGLPFHLLAAGSAGAGPGHLVVTCAAAAALAAAAISGTRRAPAAHAAGYLVLAAGLPLGAYGLAEFAGMPVGAAFLASPTTLPGVLAGSCPSTPAADAAPVLVAAALLAGWTELAARRGRTAPA